MRADILSYSRSCGLFAGISLEGSTLRPDNEANEKLYRKKLPAKDIVLDRAVLPPGSAMQLLAVLNKKSPRNKSHVGSAGAPPGNPPLRQRDHASILPLRRIRVWLTG